MWFLSISLVLLSLLRSLSLPSSALRNSSSIPHYFSLYATGDRHHYETQDQNDDTAAVEALSVQKFDLCKSSEAHQEL
jgi:hypothetical protein